MVSIITFGGDGNFQLPLTWSFGVNELVGKQKDGVAILKSILARSDIFSPANTDNAYLALNSISKAVEMNDIPTAEKSILFLACSG